MKRRERQSLLPVFVTLCAVSAALPASAQDPVTNPSEAQFSPPEHSSMPVGKMGEAIQYGQKLLSQTRYSPRPTYPARR